MKKVLITAATGMLGSTVYNVLKDDYSLILLYKSDSKLKLLEKVYGGLKNHRTIKFDFLSLREDYLEGFPKTHIGKNARKLLEVIGDVDAVINTAGVIKQNKECNLEDMLFINGAIPHILSMIYQEKLIHITTDCVFNGIEDAPYGEYSSHTPNDLYGLSKSIGEPRDRSLVFRTSIIGPEISGNISLLEWVRSQDGKEVNGYMNHLWNGLTTRQFAIICREIINHREHYPKNGLFHLFSTTVSKYQMVKLIADKYKINVRVNPVYVNSVDRRLKSEYELSEKLKIPSFEEMLKEL